MQRWRLGVAMEEHGIDGALHESIDHSGSIALTLEHGVAGRLEDRCPRADIVADKENSERARHSSNFGAKRGLGPSCEF